MRIWGLSDTHLSFAHPKPMDIFGEHWRDHPDKIASACAAVIDPGDLLLMPGDLSWAMKRPEATQDLEWLAALPGIKVLSKGNHDYWWDSDKPLAFDGLHDTPHVSVDGSIGIAGTRGWTSPTPQMTADERQQCDKIISREVGRLTKRLAAIKDCPVKIALIHYPPIDEFAELLKSESVSTVLYGHLHVSSSESTPPENWHGMRSICVACDRIGFRPKLIMTI